jgi:cysteinyl-tRNA synthetase
MKAVRLLQHQLTRQCRLLFLLHHWVEPMELTSVASGDGMFVQCEPAVAADKTLSEFFYTVKALQRACSDLSSSEHAWGDRERDLAAALESTKMDVHAALCDNVDTPRTLRALLV